MNVLVRTGSYTEHYFHFFYGYLVPFLNSCPPSHGVRYLFRSCGPVMNRIILGLEGYNTGIYENQQIDREVELTPHDNPEFTDLDFEMSRRRIFSLIGLEESSVSRRLLVVHRSDPDEFYLREAFIRGSGKERRDVPNMREVFGNLDGFMDCRFLCMEGMSLRDQMMNFRDASCIVLQHGAAMSNLICCRRGTAVFEIGTEHNAYYYKKLIGMAGVRHFHVRQEHDHAPVDSGSLCDVIRRKMVIL